MRLRFLLPVLPLLLLGCQPPAAQHQTAQHQTVEMQPTQTQPIQTPPAENQPTENQGGQDGGLQRSEGDAAPAALELTILARYPHDSAAFTEGLQYVEGRLLESTGLEGQSGVRWVNLQTGQVEAQTLTPNRTAFGEGVTMLGGSIYHLTWQTGEAYRMTPALETQQTYTYQGEGWGLTGDGRELIMSNGSAQLLFRDPKTFAVTRTVTVTDSGQPVTQLNELEWAQGAVWANVWMQNRIARIDPQTGRVTGWLDISPLVEEAAKEAAAQGHPFGPDDVPNGIAYNAQSGSFLLTGKRWPVLFEVKVQRG